MRIIYVTSTLPYGPGEPFVIPELIELERRGHEVLLVPMNPRGDLVHEDVQALMRFTVARPLLGARVIAAAAATALRYPRRTGAAVASVFASRTVWMLAKNLAVVPKGLWLARLARRWGADHIHAHWAACTSTIALTASKVASIPWSMTAHRWDIAEDNLLNIKLRSATFVRAINRNGAAALQRAYSADAFDPAMIHMGVRLPPCPPARPVHSGPIRGLMAANLVEVKGHVYLLRAMAELARRDVDVQLDLAGSGPLQAELERLVEGLGIADRVRFLGQLSHRSLLGEMQSGRWDFVVLSSIVTESGDYEGTPVVLMEAMSNGIPVISTLTGGIPELLEKGAGILVPDKDPTALANAMEELAGDAGCRARLSVAGRRRVEESFSIDSVIDELERQFVQSQRA